MKEEALENKGEFLSYNQILHFAHGSFVVVGQIAAMLIVS
jgi:hypothetical protein